MSKCEACGGDGQIEYGAYRGDVAGPTRECRLCGGVTTTVVAIPAGASVDHAVEVLTQLGQAAMKAGDSVGKWSDYVANNVSIKEPERHRQRKAALRTAREVADARLEQLRQENERLQLKAEAACGTNDTMNRLLRNQ